MRGPGIALLAAATLAGCNTAGPVKLSSAPAETSWDAIVAEHTRRHEVYHELIREADLRATLITPRFRKAFQDHRAAFAGRIADDLRMEFVALGQRPDEGVDAPMLNGPKAEEEVLVVVAFYARDQSNTDLAASDSIWTTELIRGKAHVRPKKIEPWRYDPAVVAIFPHVDRFDQIYLMRFPLVDAKTGVALLSPGGPPLVLDVKSALAHARVQWEMTE